VWGAGSGEAAAVRGRRPAHCNMLLELPLLLAPTKKRPPTGPPQARAPTCMRCLYCMLNSCCSSRTNGEGSGAALPGEVGPSSSAPCSCCSLCCSRSFCCCCCCCCCSCALPPLPLRPQGLPLGRGLSAPWGWGTGDLAGLAPPSPLSGCCPCAAPASRRQQSRRQQRWLSGQRAPQPQGARARARRATRPQEPHAARPHHSQQQPCTQPHSLAHSLRRAPAWPGGPAGNGTERRCAAAAQTRAARSPAAAARQRRPPAGPAPPPLQAEARAGNGAG
jgi:hypothetical protein